MNQIDSIRHGGTSLMTHMVAGYPGRGSDIEVARGLADGGASFLEVQFPFSDPSADGVAIQTACMKALESGFRISDGFGLVSNIKSFTDAPVFIMSYGSVVYARGIRRFVKEARACGATGLIIPDLVPGTDEGLFQTGREEGVSIVPVIPPTVSDDRLKEILAQDPTYLYASLRVGITGNRTNIDDAVVTFLEVLRTTGRWVFAGFGIQTRAQVKRLAGHADTLIVGSEIVKTISRAFETGGSLYGAVSNRVRSLLEDKETVEAEETQ